MFLSKYRFEIPSLQCCGWCLPHSHCIPTSVGDSRHCGNIRACLHSFVHFLNASPADCEIHSVIRYLNAKILKAVENHGTFVKCMDKT